MIVHDACTRAPGADIDADIMLCSWMELIAWISRELPRTMLILLVNRSSGRGHQSFEDNDSISSKQKGISILQRESHNPLDLLARNQEKRFCCFLIGPWSRELYVNSGWGGAEFNSGGAALAGHCVTEHCASTLAPAAGISHVAASRSRRS
jgi:hypothetical protein